MTTPDDTQQPYFRLLRPTTQTLPIVVDVPHAGEWIPEEVAREMIVKDQVLRRDLDLYVDQIWQDAPSLGATLIASNVSRYVLDLNRADETLIARVPGIGVLSARRLGALRRERRIRFEDLTRLRCVLEKAKPFIVTQDYRPPRGEHESVVLRQQLRDTPAQMALW